MPGKLIIIEAGDGCGKATQTEKLYKHLQTEGKRVRRIEFPNYQSQSSALIKMYLRGEFGGNPDLVNPYAASTFYAVDRYASYKQDWEQDYQSGSIIIADRYTTSNMVHQAVKMADEQQTEEYLNWLWDLEFNKFGLPVPDAVIFLDMPPEFSHTLLTERRKQTATPDIHEQDDSYLKRCYDSYCSIAERYGWVTVPCTEGTRLKSIEEIHCGVVEAVQSIVSN